MPGAKISPQGSGTFFMNSSNEDPIFGKVISTYTTREAVADGFLIELLPTVSAELRDAGIRVPAYLTTGVWEKYVEVPEGMEGEQDVAGRLMDILNMFRLAVKSSKNHCDFIEFKFVCLLPNKGDWERNEKRQGDGLRLITLHATIRARDFDDPSPAIFIMKPDED